MLLYSRTFIGFFVFILLVEGVHSEENRMEFSEPERSPLQWVLYYDEIFFQKVVELSKYLDPQSSVQVLLVREDKLIVCSIQKKADDDARYEVIVASAARKAPSEIEASRKPCSVKLHDKLSRLWQDELKNTRFQTVPIQPGDGAYYHFCASVDKQSFAGRVSSVVTSKESKGLVKMMLITEALAASNGEISESRIEKILDSE